MAKHFIFIGDSVTDCHRKRAQRFQNTEAALGHGYVKILALGALQSYRVWNRGFAGFKTCDILTSPEGWPEPVEQAYCTTLMVGINDIWHRLKNHQEVSVNDSVSHLKRVIRIIKARSSHCVVMEPIALAFGEVDVRWRPIMERLSEAFEQVCLEEEVIWLPLQLNLEMQLQPESYLADGVHPSQEGHEWLAKQWLAQIEPTLIAS